MIAIRSALAILFLAACDKPLPAPAPEVERAAPGLPPPETPAAVALVNGAPSPLAVTPIRRYVIEIDDGDRAQLLRIISLKGDLYPLRDPGEEIAIRFLDAGGTVIARASVEDPREDHDFHDLRETPRAPRGVFDISAPGDLAAASIEIEVRGGEGAKSVIALPK